MRWIGWLLLALVCLLPLGPAAAQSQHDDITLEPGETIFVDCDGALSGVPTAAGLQMQCAPLAAVAVEPRPIGVHGHDAVGGCRESMNAWHPAVVGGCATGHEHGDAPPDWVVEAGWFPTFGHAANTPNENLLTHKHSGFKAFSVRFNDVDIYVVMHLDTNPGGHVSRFHSYQVWARDGSGGASHWHGWLDFGEGDQTGPNLRRFHCDDTDGTRPIIAVNDPACPGELQFENWYSRAGAERAWSWDFGFNVQAPYYAGGDSADLGSWTPTGDLNSIRRIEAAWYADRSNLRGTFWATQFGELVGGPNDPLCGAERSYGERTYTIVCLEQYVAPTMTTVASPGNAIQLTYDEAGVSLPN